MFGNSLIHQCMLDSITGTLLKKDKVIINFYAKWLHIILKLFDLSHSFWDFQVWLCQKIAILPYVAPKPNYDSQKSGVSKRSLKEKIKSVDFFWFLGGVEKNPHFLFSVAIAT